MLEGIIREGLIPRQYWTLTRSDDLDDQDVQLLAKAQFSIGIGFESGSPRMLRTMKKGNTPERYLAAIENSRSPEAGSEELDPDAQRVEGLQLAIRTKGGVPVAEVPHGFVEELEGLVETAGDRVVLTPHGRLLANEVAIRLS